VEINDGRASVPASTGNRKVAIPYCARRDADVVFDSGGSKRISAEWLTRTFALPGDHPNSPSV
jgi:hypothetical protein